MDRLQTVIKNLNLKVNNISNVPESFSSEVYNLFLSNNEKVILKIPYSGTKLKRELRILNILKDKLPVPRVLDYWDGSDGIPGAILLSYIDGKPITGNIDKKLAYDMGELLAKLHDIPMNYYEITEENSIDWWGSLKDRLNIWIEECEGTLSVDMINKILKVFEKFYMKLPKPDGPCVTHNDYRPGNILINNNKIMGLIDFESTRGGSADIDFTKMKLYSWDKYIGTKEEFIKGYNSIRPLPNIENTLPFYLFYNAIGGIAWCVRRGQLNGSFYKENMEQLKGFI